MFLLEILSCIDHYHLGYRIICHVSKYNLRQFPFAFHVFYPTVLNCLIFYNKISSFGPCTNRKFSITDAHLRPKILLLVCSRNNVCPDQELKFCTTQEFSYPEQFSTSFWILSAIYKCFTSSYVHSHTLLTFSVYCISYFLAN